MKLKTFLVKSINFYQTSVSPFTERSCKFYPTCSDYTKQALTKYGVFKGLFLGIVRILRCHPWQKPHIDHLK